MNLEQFKPSLKKLGVIQLKKLALACGSAKTGTKSVLVDMLLKNVDQRLIHGARPFRLVSVDLGIENLGIAQMVAPPLNKCISERPHVEKWLRRSLPKSKFIYPEFADMIIGFSEELGGSGPPPIDAIIMEKQRARTSSNSNIPDSIHKLTVIEGMLHTALRAKYPQIILESIPPQYIIAFWDLKFKELKKQSKKTKAVDYRLAKKARRDLVTKWLSNDSASPVIVDKAITDQLTQNSKLDDMHDAFAQGITWLTWRKNSYQLTRNLEHGVDPLHQLLIPRIVETEE